MGYRALRVVAVVLILCMALTVACPEAKAIAIVDDALILAGLVVVAAGAVALSTPAIRAASYRLYNQFRNDFENWGLVKKAIVTVAVWNAAKAIVQEIKEAKEEQAPAVAWSTSVDVPGTPGALGCTGNAVHNIPLIAAGHYHMTFGTQGDLGLASLIFYDYLNHTDAQGRVYTTGELWFQYDRAAQTVVCRGVALGASLEAVNAAGVTVSWDTSVGKQWVTCGGVTVQCGSFYLPPGATVSGHRFSVASPGLSAQVTWDVADVTETTTSVPTAELNYRGDLVTNPPDLVGRTVTVPETVTTVDDVQGVTAEEVPVDVPEAPEVGLLGRIAAATEAVATAISTGLVGDWSRVNWKALQVPIIDRFPFSLPWDISAAIGGLAVDAPQTLPPFRFQFWNPSGGEPYQWEQEWPEFVYQLGPFVRGAFLTMFGIGLIYATKQLMGGGE